MKKSLEQYYTGGWFVTFPCGFTKIVKGEKSIDILCARMNLLAHPPDPNMITDRFSGDSVDDTADHLVFRWGKVCNCGVCKPLTKEV